MDKYKMNFSTLLVIVTLAFIPWCAWMGYNSLVSLPAYFLMSAVFVTDAQPGSTLFESFRWVTQTSAKYLHVGPNWNVTEYTLQDGEQFSFELMRKLTKGFVHPVIFRGLAKDLPILKNWSDPHYFIDTPKYADTEVLVVQNAKLYQQWEYARNATTYGSELDQGGLFQVQNMKLGDTLERMLRGENVYVQNIDILARRHPEMLQQMQFQDMLPNWKNGVPFQTALCQWFMGVGSKCTDDTTGTSMHCAFAANMFYMLVGGKTWTWIRPEYSPYLLPHYESHVFAGFAREIPDWVPRAQATLHAGDVLFNPPYLWHEVANNEGWTMAAANRVIFPHAALRMQPFAHFMSDLFADPFAHNRLMFQNRPFRRALLATPIVRTLSMLALGDGYIEPTATENHCDEHNLKYCKASFDQSLMKTTEFKKQAGLA